MTIAELIEELQKHPPYRHVVVETGDGNVASIFAMVDDGRGGVVISCWFEDEDEGLRHGK